MVKKDNELLKFLRRSIELSESAANKGNHPFGALIVLNGKILLEGENMVCTNNDITQHAELNLISEASRTLSQSELKNSTIFSSSEPCAMCAGAIYWSGIRKIVFGCSAKTIGIAANESFTVARRSIFALSGENFEIHGPLLEEEASLIHKKFWNVKFETELRNEENSCAQTISY